MQKTKHAYKLFRMTPQEEVAQKAELLEHTITQDYQDLKTILEAGLKNRDKIAIQNAGLALARREEAFFGLIEEPTPEKPPRKKVSWEFWENLGKACLQIISKRLKSFTAPLMGTAMFMSLFTGTAHAWEPVSNRSSYRPNNQQSYSQNYRQSQQAPIPHFLRNGIPQNRTPWNQPDIFPNGRPRFSSRMTTPVPSPTKSKNGIDLREISPASLIDPLLSRVSGGADQLIRRIQQNYELNADILPYEINYSQRNDLTKIFSVSQQARQKMKQEMAATGDKYIDNVGFCTKKLVIIWNPGTQNNQDPTYNGHTGRRKDNDVLVHELYKTYLGDFQNGTASNRQYERDRATTRPTARETVVTDQLIEYTASTTDALNELRSVTGRKMIDPQEIHRALDEIERTPQILDKLNPERSRALRSYLYLLNANPTKAQYLREAIARDGQFLVKSVTPQALKETQKIAQSPGPKQIDPSTKGFLESAIFQVESPSAKIALAQNVLTEQKIPQEAWDNITKTQESPDMQIA